MEPVAISELKDIAQYEEIRPEFRRRVMAEKERRRLGVGPVFTFLFENHLTVLYQVQEMMRAERIVRPDAIAYEVDTYNELIPRPGALGATLLIEFTDPVERARELTRLVGLEGHIWLTAAGLPSVAGVLDARQLDEGKISSVQYIHFPLTPAHPEAWRKLGGEGGLRLEVDHPHYTHATVLPPILAEALAGDLGV